MRVHGSILTSALQSPPPIVPEKMTSRVNDFLITVLVTEGSKSIEEIPWVIFRRKSVLGIVENLVAS